MYKPAKHNSLSPYLLVEDAQITLDFIRAVFAAEPELVTHSPDGQLNHVEVRIDDSVLMIGQAPGGAVPSHIHLYVADVDASFAKAKAAGGQVVQEPVQKDDADRRGGITDPSGNTWWLATTQGYNNAS